MSKAQWDYANADRIGECDDCHSENVEVWDYGALSEGGWQYCGFCMTRRGWGDIV